MRVVITGATGNTGSALLRLLATTPQVESVLGVARRPPLLALPQTAWVSADISRHDLTPIFRGADAVVHLAWLIQPSRQQGWLRQVNVEGSRRVFQATVAAGVPSLIYASSWGAYSPGPRDRRVEEDWPTNGIPTSFYARHKAATERILDDLEVAHPELRVVRIRPALIFQRDAATRIKGLFLGPLVPGRLLDGALPAVPLPPSVRLQAVHAEDAAEAYRLALLRPVRGAFNVVADPVLESKYLARLLGGAVLPVPTPIARAALALSWRARLQPTPPGWLDMAMSVPMMSNRRAREELGWTPRASASEAFADLLRGFRHQADFPTPPLSRGSSSLAAAVAAP